MSFELRDYQVEGIQKLRDNKRFYLWDEPGMGKTVQLIRAADRVADRVLVACPANIVIQWQEKIAELSEAKIRAEVVSYNKLTNDYMRYRREKFSAAILDEGHYLKNHKAKRTKAVFGARSDAVGGIIENIPYVWDATGSPAPNNYAELWSKLRAMTPQAITMASGRVMDYFSFIDRFCITQQTGFGVKITGNKNTDLLRERLKPFMVRRLKKDYRNPPVIDTLMLKSDDALKALRDAEQSEEGQMITRVLASHGVGGLEALSGQQSATLRRLTGLAKVDILSSQILDEIEGGLKKLVVIAYHRDVIEGMQALLEKAGIKVVVYYGGMTPQQKERSKALFIKDERYTVFIGQITAAGTGTDGLQEVCGDMILAEYSWVPEENKQIIARLDRMGGWENIVARFATLKGSLDEKISASVRRKTADIVALLG